MIVFVNDFDNYSHYIYSSEPEAIQILVKQFGLGVGPGLVDQENFRDFQLRKEFQEAYFGYSRLAEKWSKDDIETKG